MLNAIAMNEEGIIADGGDAAYRGDALAVMNDTAVVGGLRMGIYAFRYESVLNREPAKYR